MYTVCTEMVSGARSHGYECDTREGAMAAVKRIQSQLRGVPNVEIVLLEDGKEVSRYQPESNVPSPV